jgi:hypothetical protein
VIRRTEGVRQAGIDTFAVACGAEGRATKKLPPRGLEPPTQASGKTPLIEEGGAKSGALNTDSCPIDPALARIVEVWPKLPEAIRMAMEALAKSGR